jgi:hypothetical protein
MPWDPDATWVLVAVEAELITGLDFDGSLGGGGGRVTYPHGEVIFSGDRVGAALFMADRTGSSDAMIGGVALGGERAIVEALGPGATALAGDHGQAYGGRCGLAISGAHGLADVGRGGRAIAGDDGFAVAGCEGSAEAGDRGTAVTGAYGIACAGEGGRVRGGKGAELRLRYADEKAERYRIACAYVGEASIEPDTLYQLDTSSPPRFVKVRGRKTKVVEQVAAEVEAA